MNENNAFIASMFKALCDENRVAIVKLLQSGERCACDLQDALGIAQSKLSYHMKILCDSKIVESRCVGKWTHYRISKAGSAFAIETLKEITKVNTDIEKECTCAQTSIEI